MLFEFLNSEDFERARARLIISGHISQKDQLLIITIEELSEPHWTNYNDIRITKSRKYIVTKQEWELYVQKIGVSDHDFALNTLQKVEQQKRFERYLERLRLNILSGLLEDIYKHDAPLIPQYESKWISLVNILYHNSSLSISKIAKAGSRAKHTDITQSDLDVVFCVSPDKSRDEIYPLLLPVLKAAYPKIAQINIGDMAIHIDFVTAMCKIDLVLKSQSEFEKEHALIQDIDRLEDLYHKAIKLIKFAMESSRISFKKGIEMELEIFGLDEADLPRLLARFLSLQDPPIAEALLSRLTNNPWNYWD